MKKGCNMKKVRKDRRMVSYLVRTPDDTAASTLWHSTVVVGLFWILWVLRYLLIGALCGVVCGLLWWYVYSSGYQAGLGHA